MDGIPCFVPDPSAYWGEIAKPKMQEINRLARQEGWEKTVEGLIQEKYCVLYNSITLACRADWRVILPSGPDVIALDVGSGLGSLAFALARYCGLVVSLEPIWERIEFQKIRQEQQKYTNVQLVWGDALHLPFAPDSFDVILFNGVLEWLGTYDSTRPVLEIQKAALRRAYELLQDGGVLYIGIENRFGIDQLLGATDPHGKHRYTSIMPRKLADWYVRRKGDGTLQMTLRPGGYRTYTHSYWGHHKLLREVGFDEVHLYAVFPSYSVPLHWVPLGDSKLLHYYLNKIFFPTMEKARVWSRWLVQTSYFGVARYIVPHFAVLASKKRTASTR